jgi:catechol 2,3-dioxygenase-like lactoylglutathione lyase family enzyme
MSDLDFLYIPTRDAAAEAAYFSDVLGAEIVFTIESGDTRVAAVRFDEQPLLLFADHLEGERPFMIFRTEDLATKLDELERNGWTRAESFEIPHGPCCTFETPAGHRVGFYELARPEAAEHFAGRRDF